MECAGSRYAAGRLIPGYHMQAVPPVIRKVRKNSCYVPTGYFV